MESGNAVRITTLVTWLVVFVVVAWSAFCHADGVVSHARQALETDAGGATIPGRAQRRGGCRRCRRPQPAPVISFQNRIILANAARAIQQFKKTITRDPTGVTKTWRGRLCVDPGSYKGFICDQTVSDGFTRVALVNFNGFAFEGNPLRPTDILDKLPDIIVFHSNSNNFSGRVPAVANKVSNLFELDFSNNKLQGAFPQTILGATNLTFLDVRFNALNGTVPRQVFTLDLDVLFLNNNKFGGTIPNNIGRTPVLYLTLANNKFTGPIPASLGNAGNTLLEILLLNNRLSGCLPHEIGKLKKLTLFDASLNRLTGPIPYSYGCLRNLQYFNLAHNQLYGEVPEYLCKLKHLVKVTLLNNYFTQVGPACRKLINATILNVDHNCISDLNNQRSDAECQRFFSRRKSCPNPNQRRTLPCTLNTSALPEASAPVTRKLLSLPLPRTYAALQRP